MNEQYNKIEEKRKPFDITARDVGFMIALLAASVFLSVVGIFGGFAIGFTASALVLTAVMSLYLIGKGCKFNLYSFIALIFSIGLALNFSFTSNISVKFFSFVLFYLLTLVWLTSLVRKEEGIGDIGFACHFLSPVYEMLKNIPISFLSVFNNKKAGAKAALKILIGIVLALPLVLIVVPLLMASDEAFSGMVSIIFEESSSTLFKSIFGMCIGVLAVSYALSLKKGEQELKSLSCSFKIDSAVVLSFLSVLSVCYLSYLFSQLAYFFTAFSGFLPEGYEFTLSGYARRGFFEMTIIAAINFVVIMLCTVFLKRENKRLTAAVNIISSFICAFTLMIIATALSKMFLYIDNYGMTVLRITVSSFMLFLAVVFTALIIRLYTVKVNVIKTALATAAIILIILGGLNVNGVVAGYNYNAYKSGELKTVDIKTIAGLGDEGIPYLVLLAEDENEEIAEYARYRLSQAYEDYYYFKYYGDGEYELNGRYYEGIWELNIPRKQAYDELEKYIKKNPEILHFKDEYTDYENEASDYIRQ